MAPGESMQLYILVLNFTPTAVNYTKFLTCDEVFRTDINILDGVFRGPCSSGLRVFSPASSRPLLPPLWLLFDRRENEEAVGLLPVFIFHGMSVVARVNGAPFRHFTQLGLFTRLLSAVFDFSPSKWRRDATRKL